MIALDLFGMNGTGKTTTIRKIEKCCSVVLPVADNDERPYFLRNFLKTKNVCRVVFRDFSFAARLLKCTVQRCGWNRVAIKRWYNICYRGYYYLFESEQRVVLGGGILHKLWKLYGLEEISEEDRRNIHWLLKYFRCRVGYFIDESVEVLRERNRNRGKNTPLERRLDEMDFFYANFHEFVEILREEIEIYQVQGELVEERVAFLLEHCELLRDASMDRP